MAELISEFQGAINVHLCILFAEFNVFLRRLCAIGMPEGVCIQLGKTNSALRIIVDATFRVSQNLRYVPFPGDGCANCAT